MKTQVFSGTAKGAAEIIRNGGLVAVPTETDTALPAAD